MNTLNGIEDKDWIEVFKNLHNGIIPEAYPKLPENGVEPYNIWDKYTSMYSYSPISTNWIQELIEAVIGDGKCLEVMCGSGLLSHALMLEGIDVIATDNNTWSKANGYDWDKHTFVNIEEIDAVDAVIKYGRDIDFVIMSWPPHGDPIASNVLSTMRKVNPNCTLIYIGEDYGGMTSDDEFFEMSNIIKDKEDYMIKINELYQPFKGIHDQIMLIK